MSHNLLLLVLCCVSGLGNSSLFPQLLLKSPPIAQPVSPYAADYEKPAEVYHQPMTGYVVPVVPAVRTLPQLDLSSHWNTIGQKWLAWKSSLKSLLEAKMQALKPQFRQQQVMLVAPVAVAPRLSYSKPAKKPNCCCNCAPVYTTPKPYTPKPCCCCPTPYTTAKPYTTPKPYQSPICCFKMMIPQTTPYYSTPQAYQTTLKPYYGPTAAYSTIKSYYPSPKAYESTPKPTKYTTPTTPTPVTFTPTTTKTTTSTNGTTKPSTIYITSTHVYATDYTTAKYDKYSPSQNYYGYSEPILTKSDDSHQLEVISNLTMKGLNRIKRGTANLSLDLTDVVKLIDALNLQNVTARVVCQLACNRSEYSKAGENIYDFVSLIQFPDGGDVPDVGIYSEAALLGFKLKKNNDCKKCLQLYNGCQ